MEHASEEGKQKRTIPGPGDLWTVGGPAARAYDTCIRAQTRRLHGPDAKPEHQMINRGPTKGRPNMVAMHHPAGTTYESVDLLESRRGDPELEPGYSTLDDPARTFTAAAGEGNLHNDSFFWVTTAHFHPRFPVDGLHWKGYVNERFGTLVGLGALRSLDEPLDLGSVDVDRLTEITAAFYSAWPRRKVTQEWKRLLAAVLAHRKASS